VAKGIKPVQDPQLPSLPLRRLVLVLSAQFLIPISLFAWTDGELLIWMDSDRGQALELIAKSFEKDLGIKVRIDTPENIITAIP
jgi:hypothetical protein